MIRKAAFGWLLIVVPMWSWAQETKTLTLAEALKTAVERNLDIQLERLNVDTRNLSFDLTRAKYEPLVTSVLTDFNGEQEPSNQNQGGLGLSFSISQTSLNTTFEKKEDFGFTFRAKFDNSQSTSNFANAFGETFSSDLSIEVEQELLRGFGFDSDNTRRDEYLAKYDVTISRHDLALRMGDVLQQTETAYWDLVLANEQLKVAQQSLALAKQLYEQNKTKIEVGTLAPIELVNTEATVASRERDIVESENNVRAADDTLKKMMNLAPELWLNTLKPAEELSVQPVPYDLARDLETALSHRPEIQKNAIEREKALLNLKYQRNQLLPGLKLFGSYQSSGNDLAPPTSYSNAFDEALNNEFPSYTLQLQFNWTPFNKAARLNMAQANVDLRRNELAFSQTELNIREEVRSAIRELDSNLKSVRANEKTVRFREENLKAEEQKFQNGLSTNYRVAEVQEELSRARSDLIQSKTAYLKALVAYRKALGTLVQDHNIYIQ